MGNFDTNPFARAALSDTRLLAGRNIELRKIRFILRNASIQVDQIRSMIISGSRGVGKTSFLNIIYSDCIAYNIIPIRINLTTENTRNQHEFFWYLFDQLIREAFKRNLLGGINGEIDLAIQNIIDCDNHNNDIAYKVFNSPTNFGKYLKNSAIVFDINKFISDLLLIREEIADSSLDEFDKRTKFVFLIDEAHLIYSSTEIVQSLRIVLEKSALGYGFIFAGDDSYESSEWENVLGGSQRYFDLIRIGYFTDIDDVVSFFKKSLDSIGWSSDEIENRLFYRMKHTCMQILRLTSGRPEWINFVAKKMFDRCMEGESSVLKFDKETQNEIKQILQTTGVLDMKKLDYIDSLSSSKKKWLSKIFSSEGSTLNQVYFFAKFLLNDENELTYADYLEFCNNLIENGIIVLSKNTRNKHLIGYSLPANVTDFADIPFVAFGFEYDTIKHWLQINSDGKFRFEYFEPRLKFIDSINSELINEFGNVILFAGYVNNLKDETLRFSNIISLINSNNPDFLSNSYDNVYHFYKVCKRLANSTERQILYAELKEIKSERYFFWNVVNFNDKDKVIGFYENSKRINRLKANIEKFNDADTEYLFELHIDNVDKPDINNFQQLIIRSGDKKKLGIIMEDKMNDLINHYVNESKTEVALKEAEFFYSLFEEGYDLSIVELNNSGYVFLSNKDFDKAKALFQEGKRKIRYEEYEKEDSNSTFLLQYNAAILEFRLLKYESALSGFKSLISLIVQGEFENDTASVLHIIDKNEEDQLVTREVRENDAVFPQISCKQFTEHNIVLLMEYLNLTQIHPTE